MVKRTLYANKIFLKQNNDDNETVFIVLENSRTEMIIGQDIQDIKNIFSNFLHNWDNNPDLYT